MSIDYRPCFIESGLGLLFAFGFYPGHDNRHENRKKSGLLIVPPFAEEMNKSRRMLSQLAKIAAGNGCPALLFDLFGTGDSEGDFQDASWDGWCEDLRRAYDHLLDMNVEEVCVLAERTGALLVSDVIRRGLIDVHKLILWQPVVAGDVFMNQFFRLRLAAEMSDDSSAKGGVQQINKELHEAGVTEIAGYSISRTLVESMNEKKLVDMADGFQGELHWCEIVSATDRPLSAVAQKATDQLIRNGVNLTVHKIVGHPFWCSTEIEDVPDLLHVTAGMVLQ